MVQNLFTASLVKLKTQLFSLLYVVSRPSLYFDLYKMQIKIHTLRRLDRQLFIND